jgi:hypothetical protein
VQKQRGLVQQPFWRLDPLHHHAAGQCVQPDVFFRRQFLAGEDYHGQIAYPCIIADALQHLEA